ncbi:MAG: Beta-ketoacyl-acyl-carrier-protein synthase [Proteobacteria bacterium]|nr:Beta-ketoacyl-acyl-carrier-protein synthase [Pseudomonadota bacterium]
MYLNDLGIVCALGAGRASVLSRLLAAAGAPPAAWGDTGIPAFAVTENLPEVPARLWRYDCRNSRLLLATLQQIRPMLEFLMGRYGPERTGIVIGTSTSGIAEGETAVAMLLQSGRMPEAYHYKQQELGGAAEFLAECLGTTGPALTISTTCSSSANALATARRLLRLGVCDLVIAGGADTLCRTTLRGFSALAAISKSRCNPFSRNRDGITLGEGAALFLMSRDEAPVALLGVGSGSDAYHISAPNPNGDGAFAAMGAALHDAGLSPAQVDYINLHGTATRQNDAMEAKAVTRLFGRSPPCSSTKAVTGHCLGAAGAIEAAFCWLLLSELNAERCLPPHCWDGVSDPELPALDFVGVENRLSKQLQYCISNSFAFGGNNVCLAIGRP